MALYLVEQKSFNFCNFGFLCSKNRFLNDKLDNFAKNSYTLNLLKETGSFIMNQPLTENSLDHANEKLQDIVSDLNNTQKGE